MYITENPHRKMLDFYIMPQGNEVEPHLGQSKSRQGQLLFSCQGALAAAFCVVLLCWSGTRPDIDLLPYVTTRRFVFPQVLSEKRKKFPDNRQPYKKNLK